MRLVVNYGGDRDYVVSGFLRRGLREARASDVESRQPAYARAEDALVALFSARDVLRDYAAFDVRG